MKDLISIVVPIYNVEQYLEKCINSIINQTYKNLEIILINDGSTDSSSTIIDKYKLIDSRIKVIHKENGGLSDARNRGIEIAAGKYITFIDSDDYVELDYVEYLYNLIIRYSTNISFCKYDLIFDNDKKIKDEKHNINKDGKYSKIFALKDILYSKNFEFSACAKMFLTEHFKDIKFPKGKLYEDNDTIYKLIDKNEDIALGFEKKYNYVMRNDSITKKNFDEKHLYLITAVDNMCSFLSKYPELNDALYRKKFWSRIGIFNRMINSNCRNYKNERKLKKEILSYKKILIDKNCSLKDKISIILLFLGTPLYKLSWNFYRKIRSKT